MCFKYLLKLLFDSFLTVWLSDKSNDNTNALVNIVKENNKETVDKTSTVKALPEVTALRVTNIRKASISMPSKLDEMDDVRIDRQNVSELIFSRLYSNNRFYYYDKIYIFTK